ncbi:MAG: RNA polymerase sigma factor [Anaerolineales bacterium]|nr:RNA polymerase sigma factor [Anaerolineales bacterium]
MSQQLFQRAENGDALAQEKLFQQHYPVTYRMAYSLLNHREDAEEVAQDALVYALSNLGSYDPTKGAFTTWLYTITVSRCRNKRRRKQLAQIPLLGWLMGEERPTAGDINPLEQRFSRHEKHRAVREAIEQLPEKQREAVILRYFNELSYAEIGEVVGCSASTAQSRVWVAQKQLYKLLAVDEAVEMGQKL